MPFHLQESIGAHPAIGVHWHATGFDPTGRPTAGAAQAGAAVAVYVAFHEFHPCCGKHLALQSSQLLRVALQLQWALGPAAAQGKHHFEAGRPCPHHAKGSCAAGLLLCQKGQGRLQWFDGHSFSVAAPADRSDVQAQQGVRKGRSVAQLQQLPS